MILFSLRLIDEEFLSSFFQLFQVAQNYHFFHTVAILATPLVSRPIVTASLFLGGVTFFCGPIYYFAITEDTRLRRIAPYGGFLLIAGWISIAIL